MWNRILCGRTHSEVRVRRRIDPIVIGRMRWIVLIDMRQSDHSGEAQLLLEGSGLIEMRQSHNAVQSIVRAF